MNVWPRKTPDGALDTGMFIIREPARMPITIEALEAATSNLTSQPEERLKAIQKYLVELVNRPCEQHFSDQCKRLYRDVKRALSELGEGCDAKTAAELCLLIGMDFERIHIQSVLEPEIRKRRNSVWGSKKKGRRARKGSVREAMYSIPNWRFKRVNVLVNEIQRLRPNMDRSNIEKQVNRWVDKKAGQ